MPQHKLNALGGAHLSVPSGAYPPTVSPRSSPPEERAMSANLPNDIQGLSLKFLAQEIALGLTFASVAEMEYAHGRPDRGDQYRAHATHACTEAERRLHDADARRWEVSGPVRERLDALRQQIAAFTQAV